MGLEMTAKSDQHKRRRREIVSDFRSCNAEAAGAE